MFDDSAKQESTWGTPLRILMITLVIATGFLYYYFGPSLKELQGNTPEASANSTAITLLIGGEKFIIPENYTQFPRARHGGVRENVALYAMLPDYAAFTIPDEEAFKSNEPDSPIIHFQLESVRSPFGEDERLQRTYMPSVVDLEGERDLYGLTLYQFLDGSGYQDQDLYVGTDSQGQKAALTCAKKLQEILPPSCRRFTQLTETVMLSYRFKRGHLRDWKEIDDGIRKLARSFVVEGSISVEDIEESR